MGKPGTGSGAGAPPSRVGIDFFDVDHTLTRRSSGARFIVAAIRRRVLPRYLLFIMAWYSLTYRLGLFKPGEYGEGFPHLKPWTSISTTKASSGDYYTPFRRHVNATTFRCPTSWVKWAVTPWLNMAPIASRSFLPRKTHPLIHGTSLMARS